MAYGERNVFVGSVRHRFIQKQMARRVAHDLQHVQVFNTLIK
jgi:hypothetical protein